MVINMYLKINNKKLQIKEYTKFKDKFKTFKFYLKDINYGIKIPKKKHANTYFFCQKVDICFTDKNNKIIKLNSNIKSDKIIFCRKAHNVYYFPLGTNKFLKIDETLKIKM